MKLILICFIFFGHMASLLLSAPSLNGHTGLITIPTAEALNYKEFNTGFDYIIHNTNKDPDSLDETKNSDNEWFYKVNFGLFENVEMGLLGGTTPTEGVLVNIKYYLMNTDSSQYPIAIAIGLEKLSSNLDSSAYMVASKSFPGGLNLHFGFKALFSEEINPSIMGGVEYLFSDRLSILGDIYGQKQSYLYNAGVRIRLFNQLYVSAYAIDIANEKEKGIQYSTGISYSYFF